MLNVNPVNLICTILNLFILLGLLKKFLYQPVLSVIEERKEFLESQLKEAKKEKEEARQLKEEYEDCLAKSKEETTDIIRQAKVHAMAEHDKIVAEADEKAKQILIDAKEAGKREKARVIKEAEVEIVDLAMAAASKLLDEMEDGKTDSSMYEALQKEAGE